MEAANRQELESFEHKRQQLAAEIAQVRLALSVRAACAGGSGGDAKEFDWAVDA